MTKPVVKGVPQVLKKKKKQKFYLYGDDIQEEFEVRLTKHVDLGQPLGQLLWKGTIKKENKGVWIAEVDRVDDLSADEPGDMELVDVTVINSAGTPSSPFPTGVMPILPDFP